MKKQFLFSLLGGLLTVYTPCKIMFLEIDKSKKSGSIHYERYDDRCGAWANYGSGRISTIYLRKCQKEGASWYYTQFNNTNELSVRISYVLNYDNGRSFRGSTNIPANSESSQISIGTNVNVSSWQITKLFFQGEEGYW